MDSRAPGDWEYNFEVSFQINFFFCSLQADEVVMEHLIVGVLLFTPLLALLPTTMVFYASLLAVYLVTAALQSCLVVLCEAIAVDHIYFASLRFLRPGLLPGMLPTIHQHLEVMVFRNKLLCTRSTLKTGDKGER